MGSYADKLGSRLRRKEPTKPAAGVASAERLIAAAIMRGGEVLEGKRGFRSHYELRQVINSDSNGDRREPGDVEGFVTNTGRFLTRRQAVPVAVRAKQIHESWLTTSRDLLSSDISW